MNLYLVGSKGSTVGNALHCGMLQVNIVEREEASENLGMPFSEALAGGLCGREGGCDVGGGEGLGLGGLVLTEEVRVLHGDLLNLGHLPLRHRQLGPQTRWGGRNSCWLLYTLCTIIITHVRKVTILLYFSISY